jgi:hypothetical protein
VLLLGDEDRGQQLAGRAVVGLDAGDDRLVEPFDRVVLELEVELELLLDGLADVDLAEALDVGDALEEEDPLDQASACFISSIDSARILAASLL